MTRTVAAEIPVIETERAVLRAHRIEDLDAYAAMWADPEVVRFTIGKPLGRGDAWIRLLRQSGHWRLLGFGFWVVEDKHTGRLIGEAGFHDIKRDMMPSIDGLPEAGWALLPAVQGRGMATEIMTAAHRWSDVQFGGAKTVCIIDPQNAGSIRVAHKCGYRPAGKLLHGGTETLLFER